MNTLTTELQKRGFDVVAWEMPHSHGETMLQVTITEPGPAQGATLYIGNDWPLNKALNAIYQKRMLFEQSGQKGKEV